jgi:hypothetical protein
LQHKKGPLLRLVLEDEQLAKLLELRDAVLALCFPLGGTVQWHPRHFSRSLLRSLENILDDVGIGECFR